jgi:hypothetical protein
MSKIKQDKVYLTQDENGNLHFDAGNLEKVLFHDPYANYPYKLVRERDGLTKYGREMGWVEWKPDGTFSKLHDKPTVGLSCILDPHRMSFTWLTTSITNILEEQEDYVKFTTLNSIYELWKLKND